MNSRVNRVKTSHNDFINFRLERKNSLNKNKKTVKFAIEGENEQNKQEDDVFKT